MRGLLGLLLFIVSCNILQAQATTYQDLNNERIHTNMLGMKVLGSWGAINTIGGIAGYLSADKEETQRFHQMNAIWGIVNFGIAGAGYIGARKELQKKYTSSEALKRYESSRRLYMINAGLDGIYIGTGLFLISHAKNTTNHPEVWRGYGNSILLQGISLLAFDAVMFSSHTTKNKAWRKVLDGICFSGNGIEWHCSL